MKVSVRPPKDGSFFKNLPKSSAIKLIDFGSTTFEHQDHNYVVLTRHYRAPEVILGINSTTPPPPINGQPLSFFIHCYLSFQVLGGTVHVICGVWVAF
jgi:serine/threonine protein kinase